MRLHQTLFYALAISAWTTLFAACGQTPPADGGDTSLPLCSDPNRKADSPCVEPDGGTPTDGGGQTVDAGTPDAGTPTDPCQGFVVPLATKCAGDYIPVTCTWELRPLHNPDRCLLVCQGTFGCIMTQEMSGATEFTCTTVGNSTAVCTE